jgi:hypothetical protein
VNSSPGNQSRSTSPSGSSAVGWLPWWTRPSLLLLGASLPALLLFSVSDSRQTLSRAQLFYGNRDLLVGIAAIILLACGAILGESRLFQQIGRALRPGSSRLSPHAPIPRLGETMLSERFDQFLMGVFLIAHLIFLRDFFLNPGLAMAVLGGNVELKHDFKTIPGVTIWTQVSLLLGVLRGLRWSGILPGKIKLISWFHIAFFGTLFIRALLWSERLALIEGGVPFFLGALPRLAANLGPRWRTILRLLPLLLPVMLLVVFTAFEALRSWQYYSGQHASIFQFGWLRLYTYYFEAMNTGAAILGQSGFYDGLTGPLSKAGYDHIYDGLYLGSLDVEYNNTSGIWYIAVRNGNLLFAPVFLMIGAWFGATWRSFVAGRLFGLFYPFTFIGLMEIIRIPYWMGINRAMPTTLVIVLILCWAATLKYRIRPRRADAVSGHARHSAPSPR